jgi:hypothetical protein
MSQLAASVQGGDRYRRHCIRLQESVIICCLVEAGHGRRRLRQLDDGLGDLGDLLGIVSKWWSLLKRQILHAEKNLIRSQAESKFECFQLLFWLQWQLCWLNSISQICTSY